MTGLKDLLTLRKVIFRPNVDSTGILVCGSVFSKGAAKRTLPSCLLQQQHHHHHHQRQASLTRWNEESSQTQLPVWHISIDVTFGRFLRRAIHPGTSQLSIREKCVPPHNSSLAAVNSNETHRGKDAPLYTRPGKSHSPPVSVCLTRCPRTPTANSNAVVKATRLIIKPS